METRIRRLPATVPSIAAAPRDPADPTDAPTAAPPDATPPDERLLMDLSGDWSERTGCFGAALGMLYGMAVGLGATRIMEVGVRFGGSTRAFLLAARRTGGRLCSIDIEDRAGFVPAELKRWWTHKIGRSVDVARDWTEPLDLLFLDGEHNYETVAQELDLLGRHVRSGGLIVLDDAWDLFPGVRRAFLEYPHASTRFLLPYGVPQAQPGGRDRTFGVLRKS